MNDLELITRLAVAVILGGIVGFERENVHKAAGLRTHMMVALGACLVMIVSQFGFSDVAGQPGVSLDPSRVAAQVVSGIGFLGAGSILFHGGFIKGITTAASVWTVAGVGLAVGGGLYIEAISATFMIITVLVGVGYFEKNFLNKRNKKKTRK